METDDLDALLPRLRPLLEGARAWIAADAERAAGAEALFVWLTACEEVAPRPDNVAARDNEPVATPPASVSPPPLRDVTLDIAGSTAAVSVPDLETQGGSSVGPDAQDVAPATSAEEDRSFGEVRTDVYDASQEREEFSPADAVERLRLKAEAIRWRVQRESLITGGADFQSEVRPRELQWRERIDQAPGRPWLWALSANLKVPPDEVMHRLAENHDALGDAVELVADLISDPSIDDDLSNVGPALQILAEVQSALRVDLDRTVDKWDADQREVFYWLKQLTAQLQIYVHRYMKSDEPADPERVADARERLTALRDEWDRVSSQQKQRHDRLGKLRYRSKRLQNTPGAGDPEDWEAAIDAVDDIIESGDEQPSSKVLREHLLPLVDRVPDGVEVPPAAALALREIRRYQRSQGGGDAADAEPQAASPPPTVAEVRRRLRGKVVVLIGGEERKHTAAALLEAFGLKELRWVATRVHQSVEPIRTAASRPDVDLVLLAIRWISHSFGEVRSTCVEAGVPLVRLPAGLNPTQVAHQIIEQASDNLA